MTFRRLFGFDSYFRSTLAWGLEARVPFLDKAFLEVSMNVDPKEKMFGKGTQQDVDEDGNPKMEKVFRTPFSISVNKSNWHTLEVYFEEGI
jgi:asparagine synthetase B (glutamine-hydrolysing)